MVVFKINMFDIEKGLSIKNAIQKFPAQNFMIAMDLMMNRWKDRVLDDFSPDHPA